MIVLDTNILLYALGAEHVARDPSRRLLAAISEGKLRATTTADVIQEFVHVYSRRRTRRDAAKHARLYVDTLSPLLQTRQADLDSALRLFARHEELDAFDALLAATAMANEAGALVSADRSFSLVRGLRHVVPGTPQFERLLGA